MELTTTSLSVFHVALFAIVLVALLRLCFGVSWEQEVSTDFMAALSRSGITSHEILVERNVAPDRYKAGEVFRILQSHHGEYFLYFYTPGARGVIQPLSEERALLAVRLNG